MARPFIVLGCRPQIADSSHSHSGGPCGYCECSFWEGFCWVSQDPGSEVLSHPKRMGTIRTSRSATNILLTTAVASIDNNKHRVLAELGLQAFGLGAEKSKSITARDPHFSPKLPKEGVPDRLPPTVLFGFDERRRVHLSSR